MLVVAVISRKSGVGKSTVAVHLAVEAAKAGPVAVVDLDVQASAAGWGDSRTAERPGILDLRAIGQSTEIAQLAGKPAAVVINAAPAVGNQASEAAEAVSETYGVEVCPVVVGQRVAFARALVSGQTAGEIEPDGKAAAEITALWQWVYQRVGMSTRQCDEV